MIHIELDVQCFGCGITVFTVRNFRASDHSGIAEFVARQLRPPDGWREFASGTICDPDYFCPICAAKCAPKPRSKP